MSRLRSILIATAAAGLGVLLLGAAPASQPASSAGDALPSVEGVNLPVYDSQYYEIHTDLDGDALREAKLRMTKMAEEYRARTRDFFGAASQKLPFYLFKNRQDYLATGAPAESDGVFDGHELLAVAGEKTTLRTWHAIQHEGFHQYVQSVIGPNLPPWLNEGLAEYFGESVFTGDGYVNGLVPQFRLERVQHEMQAGEFRPVREFLELPHSEWNAQLTVANYDQAWSMVQFLAHADGGRYQHAFAGFISDVGRGMQWAIAWRQHFGDVEFFEKRWKEWWLKLPENPTGDLYGRVGVEILTSFLARAQVAGQRFDAFDDFAEALEKGRIKCDESDWLPPDLGVDGVGLARKLGTWTLLRAPGTRFPRLALLMPDGTRLVGSFTLPADSEQVRINVETETARHRVPTSSRR